MQVPIMQNRSVSSFSNNSAASIMCSWSPAAPARLAGAETRQQNPSTAHTLVAFSRQSRVFRSRLWFHRLGGQVKTQAGSGTSPKVGFNLFDWLSRNQSVSRLPALAPLVNRPFPQTASVRWRNRAPAKSFEPFVAFPSPDFGTVDGPGPRRLRHRARAKLQSISRRQRLGSAQRRDWFGQRQRQKPVVCL
jgi:hypothetical protein